MKTRRSLTQSKFIWQYHWIFALQLLVTSLFIGANYQSFAIGVASFFGLLALAMWKVTAPLLSLFYSVIWAFVFYTFVAATTMPTAGVVVITVAGFIIGMGFNITGLAFLDDMVGNPS